MFASTTSATLVGSEPRPVVVEAHVGRSKPVFALVGLPDTAVREAKERVKAAFVATSYVFPMQSVTVNLAPADLPKAGSAFDLPIALGVLAACGAIPAEATDVVALGELALDGTVRPARGALAAAVVAARRGVPCLVSGEAAARARTVTGAEVRPVGTLAEAVRAALAPPGTGSGPEAVIDGEDDEASEPLDLADVRGQAVGRRALEIAAAGGHHLLMVGAPGCGKTMLARRLPGLLPDLSPDEQTELDLVWEAGDRRREGPRRRPPFRSPHHTASAAGLLGGGSGIPVPGEVSLAHCGVLFLDELGEFPTNLLDALRQPLEEGEVVVARRGATVRYPARSQVVAATNPCPCGYRSDRRLVCSCSNRAVERYRRKLSGPLLDRFDLRVTIHPPEGIGIPPGEGSVVVAARVAAARHIQTLRGSLNRDLTAAQLDDLDASDEAMALLAKAVETGRLSPRGYDRVRRVGRTIVDLAGGRSLGAGQVAEALALRGTW